MNIRYTFKQVFDIEDTSLTDDQMVEFLRIKARDPDVFGSELELRNCGIKDVLTDLAFNPSISVATQLSLLGEDLYVLEFLAENTNLSESVQFELLQLDEDRKLAYILSCNVGTTSFVRDKLISMNDHGINEELYNNHWDRLTFKQKIKVWWWNSLKG